MTHTMNNNFEKHKTLQDVYNTVDLHQEARDERLASIQHNVMTANSKQVGGAHYKDKLIQPWDFIIANELGYLEGNVVKYVSRWKEKNGLQDLKKAQHYLQKLIEVTEKNNE